MLSTWTLTRHGLGGANSTTGVQRILRYLYSASLSFTLLMLVACSHGSTPGDPGGGSPPDVGKYSTTPIMGLGTAKTRELGSLLESHRLADYVIGPWEVDAELVRRYYVLALDGGSSVNAVLPWQISGAALRHHYTAGFLTSRTSSAGLGLTNSVLEFPDPGAASAAVREFIELAATEPTLSVGAPIVSHPSASAYIQKAANWRRAIAPTDSLIAFSAHDQYVLVHTAWSPGDLAPAADLIAKTLDRQAPLVDQFTPTPEGELAKLLVDPTGLLARTVPISGAGTSPDGRAVYGIRGALHFQHDPIRSANTFNDAGLVRLAVAATSVYETQETGGALAIATDFYSEASQVGTPRGGVEGLLNSQCVSNAGGPDENIYCVVNVEKYAIEVSGPEVDAKQLLAAQYKLLEAG